jgi:hypothetical protein
MHVFDKNTSKIDALAKRTIAKDSDFKAALLHALVCPRITYFQGSKSSLNMLWAVRPWWSRVMAVLDVSDVATCLPYIQIQYTNTFKVNGFPVPLGVSRHINFLSCFFCSMRSFMHSNFVWWSSFNFPWFLSKYILLVWVRSSLFGGDDHVAELTGTGSFMRQFWICCLCTNLLLAS